MAAEDSRAPTAFVLGASADIGRALCDRLLADAWRVVGAARDPSRLDELGKRPNFAMLRCDLSDKASISAMVRDYAARDQPWDLFVTAAGTMQPIGPFFGTKFDAWEQSVVVNATAQLRVLHGLWPYRSRKPVDVMLMAGGGTNNPFTNYSAYCLSKIALIKMCELLDDEEEDLNIFIIGPGFVSTRIHEETLNAGERAGIGLAKTTALLETDGTSMDDIYAQLKWCIAQGKSVSSGRNFSTVHDPWRDGGKDLNELLRNDRDAFRLRRAEPKNIAD